MKVLYHDKMVLRQCPWWSTSVFYESNWAFNSQVELFSKNVIAKAFKNTIINYDSSVRASPMKKLTGKCVNYLSTENLLQFIFL